MVEKHVQVDTEGSLKLCDVEEISREDSCARSATPPRSALTRKKSSARTEHFFSPHNTVEVQR